MCGINGFVFARPPSQELSSAALTERMNRALEHRGPDDGGVASVDFGALGMRRLAIVDVPQGRQPMASPDGHLTLVFNGELYDFQAERRALEERGLAFRTRSDTEVLLNAWRADGTACLQRLNGMFAFALVDRRERTLFAARDPLGIKPLYYWSGPQGDLVLSSELGSLLAHPTVPRRLDRRSLEMLLVDRYVADPWTLLEGVHQLPPGHFLRWRDGECIVRRYRDVAFEPEHADPQEALERLRQLLDETVRSQLVADVPVGLFLSGGIDSSTVAAFATRARRGERLKTFSVGFPGSAWDESSLAREVAQHLGTEHHEVQMEQRGFELGVLDHVLDHVGQPLGDTSCIPTYVLSRLAAEHVKVVLSGDGGDEFFGGYDHMFWAGRVRRVSERTPRFARRLGKALLDTLTPLTPPALATGVRRARKGLELSLFERDQQFRRLRALFGPDELEGLCAHRDAGRELRPDCAAQPGALSPEEEVMAVLARTFMPGAILTKVDRMSMAAGLEVRVPLLDLRIVDFARRLPLGLKVRGGTGKLLLREAARPLLPASVYRHRKQGFSIPLFGWLNDEFWELLDDLYAPRSPAAELFNPLALRATLERGREAARGTSVASETNSITRVWVLALLARWMDRFGVQP